MRMRSIIVFLTVILLASCSLGQDENNGSSNEDNTNEELIEDNNESSAGEETDNNTTENSSENNSEDTRDDNSNDNNYDNNSDRTGLTEQEALDETREYLEIDEGGDVNITVDRKEDGKYIMRVYQIVEGNGSSGTSTIGWYSIDRQTGVIESLY